MNDLRLLPILLLAIYFANLSTYENWPVLGEFSVIEFTCFASWVLFFYQKRNAFYRVRSTELFCSFLLPLRWNVSLSWDASWR